MVEPAGSALADAVEAVGVAARAAWLRLRSRSAWSWASALTGGEIAFQHELTLAGALKRGHPAIGPRLARGRSLFGGGLSMSDRPTELAVFRDALIRLCKQGGRRFEVPGSTFVADSVLDSNPVGNGRTTRHPPKTKTLIDALPRTLAT